MWRIGFGIKNDGVGIGESIGCEKCISGVVWSAGFIWVIAEHSN